MRCPFLSLFIGNYSHEDQTIPVTLLLPRSCPLQEGRCVVELGQVRQGERELGEEQGGKVGILSVCSRCLHEMFVSREIFLGLMPVTDSFAVLCLCLNSFYSLVLFHARLSFMGV